MKRIRQLFAIAALSAAASLSAPPVATAAWDGGAFMPGRTLAGDGALLVQAQPQKGRGGAERGDRGGDRGRDARQDRHEDRRERLSEDDRRSLHRDLDKANRELYGRRFPK